MKKTYSKPELKSKRLELGVFGDYSNERRGTTPPTPAGVIDELRLHME